LGAAVGSGPVDAVYQAINQIVQQPNTLAEFLVQAITEGMDANGDVTIRIEVPDSRGYSETAQGRARRRLFSGRGVDTDIIVASAKAYMQALNKLIASSKDEAREGRATEALSGEIAITAG
jgi:2-isopropylmalate synthase